MPLDPTQMIVPAMEGAKDTVTSKPVQDTLSDAWNLVVGDRFAAFRLSNAAKIQAKLQKRLDELGVTVDTARIPERFAVTWFEEATKQDDPEIQDLFADLLANASLDNEDALDRIHVETISKMTPSDATLFKFIFESNRLNQDSLIRTGLRRRRLAEIAADSLQIDIERSIDHLINFGILGIRTGIDNSELNATVQQIAKATNSLAGDRKLVREPLGISRRSPVRTLGGLTKVLDLLYVTNQGVSLQNALSDNQ